MQLRHKPLFFLIPILFLSNQLSAQKIIDQVIPNAEKRRVEHAQNLFNHMKIYEGEKVLKELIASHPNDAYYHEALVQLQRQLLRKLSFVLAETNDLDTIITQSAKLNSTIVLNVKIDSNKIISDNKFEQLIKLHGLNRHENSDEESIPKRKMKVSDNPIELAEATVTIDSTLISEIDTEVKENAHIKLNAKSSSDTKMFLRKIKFLKELNAIPYESYKSELIKNARNATRLVEYADSASDYLREFLIDTMSLNTIKNEEELIMFDDACLAYYDDNYVQAATLLKNILQKYPDDYQTQIKLGDTYYMMGKDTLAIKHYNVAKELNPQIATAFEKMALACYNRGKYIEASALIIEAIIVYPQQHFFNLLRRIVAKTGQGFETQWIVKPIYPATTSKNYVEIMADDKSPWWHYQYAENEVHSYFDTLGIMRPNEKTRERYLEVYCWKKMLNNTSATYFPFARAMNQIEYLDCYVLLTLFHQDLYGQFHDFAKRNPDKIKDYFYMLINWESKKFDKLRKQFMPTKTFIKQGK
jgi:tetratricopeptide (TPR) repeat protein